MLDATAPAKNAAQKGEVPEARATSSFLLGCMRNITLPFLPYSYHALLRLDICLCYGPVCA